MDIEKELHEIEAIHNAFDDLVAHGTPSGAKQIVVSIPDLVKLKKRIERLHGDLREALRPAS